MYYYIQNAHYICALVYVEVVMMRYRLPVYDAVSNMCISHP